MMRLRTSLIAASLVGLWAVVPQASIAQNAGDAGTVGIAPAYDGGGDEWGPLFVQQLTVFLFDEVQARTLAVLLNPGGVYTPLDPSWLVDYTSDRPEVKFLLVTTLKPVIIPEHGKWTIVVDASVLERASGKEVASFTETTDIKGRNADIFVSYIETNPFKAWANNGRRTFETSPLGHSARTLAAAIAEDMRKKLELSGSAHAAGPASGASCAMKAKITYSYKHAASQSYSLLVNGLEESISLDGGVASFSAPEGPLLVQFSVNDAPYKMAKEPLYQFSTPHSCAKGMFLVDLGRSGDAHERWE